MPCIYCALAVTQSDVTWHTLMLILLSLSCNTYQHAPACIYVLPLALTMFYFRLVYILMHLSLFFLTCDGRNTGVSWNGLA